MCLEGAKVEVRGSCGSECRDLATLCTLSAGTWRHFWFRAVLFPKLEQSCSDRLAACDS